MAYNQFRAMMAITRGSLRAILRSPSAIVFSFIFPFLFIMVFGFIGNSGMQSYRVVLAPGSDTANAFYAALKNNTSIKFVEYPAEKELNEAITKGRVAGIITIKKSAGAAVPYEVSMSSSTSSNDKWPQLKNVITGVIDQISNRIYKNRPSYALFDFDYKRDIKEIRQYKTIDFILPGQLGFSLLTAGVFGLAFVFFNLRNTMVLKRFFATPISRTYIVLGEALSRVVFQMATAVIIILVGYFLFGFTLVHGVQTFFEMLLLSFLGLLVFMGFGFIISGVAKSDSSIAPFANLITMPQFLLGGTFFSVDVFPKWLQPIANIMPLTHLNTAMRSVAFEGQSLWGVRTEIGILILWGLLVYFIAIKVFRWE